MTSEVVVVSVTVEIAVASLRIVGATTATAGTVVTVGIDDVADTLMFTSVGDITVLALLDTIEGAGALNISASKLNSSSSNAC
jgi:hypothetical protein